MSLEMEDMARAEADRAIVLTHLRGTANGLVQSLACSKQRVDDAVGRLVRAHEDLAAEHARLVAFSGFVEDYVKFVARAMHGDVSDAMLAEVSIGIERITRTT